MPTQSIIDSGQCSVITSNSYDTTGTLTRADLKAATPAEVLSWYNNSADNTWNVTTPWLRHQFEMSMCGIKRMGFWDWIMSGTKDYSAHWTPKSIAGGPGYIEPFVMGMQDSVLMTRTGPLLLVIGRRVPAMRLTPTPALPTSSGPDSRSLGFLEATA